MNGFPYTGSQKKPITAIFSRQTNRSFIQDIPKKNT